MTELTELLEKASKIVTKKLADQCLNGHDPSQYLLVAQLDIERAITALEEGKCDQPLDK